MLVGFLAFIHSYFENMSINLIFMLKLSKYFFDILLWKCPGVEQKRKFLLNKSNCPFVNECLERLIIFPFESILCWIVFEIALRVLIFSFPFFKFLCVIKLLFFELMVLMAGVELIVAWSEIVIQQNDCFSLIQFLSLEFKLHFAMT